MLLKLVKPELMAHVALSGDNACNPIMQIPEDTRIIAQLFKVFKVLHAKNGGFNPL
jgi:hypothetical protein